MTYNPRVLSVESEKDAMQELERIGADPFSIPSLSRMMTHYNLSLENVACETAHILRDQMRSIGGDAALARGALDGSIESTNVILTGSRTHFERFIEKANIRAFGQAGLGDDIQEAIDNVRKEDFFIRCANFDLDLGRQTHIMGIINVTPDSFSDGGEFFDPDRAIAHAQELIDHGADIIDIGGETTRPGSKPIGIDEEVNRVVSVIERLAPKINVPISIDTYKSVVAERAIEAGAEIINDISALRFDPGMVSVVARHNVPVVLMHIKGTPENMQQAPHYDSLISEIIQHLRERIETAQKAGIDIGKIIVDPGIGFGKSIDCEHNLRIIKKLSEFKSLGRPILVGPSRKAFIGKVLDADVTEREEGTAAVVAAAMLHGANIVRVHNVRMTKKVVKMIDAIKQVA